MRVLFHYILRQWSERWGPEAVGELCQGRPVSCETVIYVKEGFPKPGRLVGCRSMSVAMHLVWKVLKSFRRINCVLHDAREEKSLHANVASVALWVACCERVYIGQVISLTWKYMGSAILRYHRSSSLGLSGASGSTAASACSSRSIHCLRAGAACDCCSL